MSGTAREVLAASEQLTKQTVAAMVDGKVFDLHTALPTAYTKLTPIESHQDTALSIIRHSSSARHGRRRAALVSWHARWPSVPPIDERLLLRLLPPRTESSSPRKTCAPSKRTMLEIIDDKTCASAARSCRK
jgi:hypothetical protein